STTEAGRDDNRGVVRRWRGYREDERAPLTAGDYDQPRGDRSGRRRDAAGLDPGSDERRAREDPDEPDAAAGGTGGWHEPSRTDVVSCEVTRTLTNRRRRQRPRWRP